MSRTVQRLLFGTAALCITVLLPAFTARAQTPELAVVGGSGSPGGTVGVVIRLANDPDNTAVTADLDIRFPTDLLELAPPVNQSCTVAARLADTHQVGGRFPEPGVLRFALFARNLVNEPLGDGELATCDFHILPGASLTTAPLAIEFTLLGDADGREIDVSEVDGAIVIANPTPTAVARCAGDCDADGTVTIDELIRAVGIAGGNLPLTACPSVDRDGDGEVTIPELIGAVNSTLGGC